MFKNMVHINHDTGEIEGDCMIGIAFGNRDAGKTVGVGLRLIINYLDTLAIGKPERFTLVARTIKQKDKGYLKNWVLTKVLVADDEFGWSKRIKGHELTFDNDKFYIDGDVCAYCVAITEGEASKDTWAPDCSTRLVLDEAVRRGERTYYVNQTTAMTQLFTMLFTMARGSEQAFHKSGIIFIANISTRDNWVYNDFGINKYLRKDTKRLHINGMFVDIVNNEDVKKEIKESIIYKVLSQSISGREYLGGAVDNEYIDNSAFILNKKLDFRFLHGQFKVKTRHMGVFKDYEGNIHVAEITPTKKTKIYCNDIYVSTDEILYKPNSELEQAIRHKYIMSKVTFQTQEVKNLTLEFIGYI